MVSTEVPYAVGKCRRRNEEEQWYKELLFLRAAGLSTWAGDTQGYLKANLTPAGTGSPGWSSCVDTNSRTQAKLPLKGDRIASVKPVQVPSPLLSCLTYSTILGSRWECICILFWHLFVCKKLWANSPGGMLVAVPCCCLNNSMNCSRRLFCLEECFETYCL